MVANTGLVQLDELYGMCTSVGVAAGTLDQIVKLGEFAGMVDPHEVSLVFAFCFFVFILMRSKAW